MFRLVYVLSLKEISENLFITKQQEFVDNLIMVKKSLCFKTKNRFINKEMGKDN